MGARQRQSVVNDIEHWLAAGQPVVLATVVASSDSAPRGLGAQLAVTVGGLWTGALSGGCTEVSVLTEAEDLLTLTGEDADRAAQCMTMTRDELGNAGPACGATISVIVERVDGALLALLATGARPSCEVTTTRAWTPIDSRFGLLRTRAAIELAQDSGASRASSRFSDDSAGEMTFSELIPPTPRLVVGGGGDVAAELIRSANALGWRTTLVDPRRAFVTQTVAREEPDQVIVAWLDGAVEAELALDARCACVAVAHEERIDVPFLAHALASPAFYVGSMGSRVTQSKRRAALAQVVDEATLARHHGPAGLNLGGGDATEIALSIIAEVLAVRNGRSGAPLYTTDEPINARITDTAHPLDPRGRPSRIVE